MPLESRYVLEPGDQNAYAFAVGSDYDRGHPLIIDPGIAYSTFVGGTAADSGRAIAVDDHGNAYVTGQTASADYPTTPGAFDGSVQNTDAFVTKFDRTGSGIVYSTFVGGFAFDSGNGIAVDDDARPTSPVHRLDYFPTTPARSTPRTTVHGRVRDEAEPVRLGALVLELPAPAGSRPTEQRRCRG